MAIFRDEHNETIEKVKLVLERVLELLIEKNKKYGNAAFDPVRIFSKADKIEQLKVRIDDKLSRILNQTEDNEDTLLDLIGYLILLRIAE